MIPFSSTITFNNNKQKPKGYLLTLLFLQFLFDITIIFDIPIARQVIGFFYLTLAPGFIIILLLNFEDELNWLELILFSAGFSISFLMIIGLILNELCLFIINIQPLLTAPLIVTLNTLLLVSIIAIYLKNEHTKILTLASINQIKLLFPLLLPLILSIGGAMLVNLNGNNFVLMLMILAVSLIATPILIAKKEFPVSMYVFLLFIIAISLVYHSSLISNYLVGFASDSHVEHFIFQNTKLSGYWNSSLFAVNIGYGRLNSMLSITILPTIYSNLLNLDSTMVLKLLFPFIFSLVPTGLYQIWQGVVNKKGAFASAFLLIAQATFYTEMLGLNRQMIGELFFVLLLITMLHQKMKFFKKMICYTIFSFALITSHYGLAEIFMFFISSVLISLIILKSTRKNITVTMVVYFLVIMFAWYIFTSNSTVFQSFSEFGDHVYKQLADFFNPNTRGQTVLRGLGLESPPTIWNAISRAFAYATEVLIVIGFVGLISRKIKPNFNREHYILTCIAMGFLVMLILVPGLAETMNMTRFYHLLLFFLAPLCILGAEIIVKLIFKRRQQTFASILLLTILVPYFLFQINFVYELTGSQTWSLPLSMHRLHIRLHTDFAFVTKEEVLGVRWLSGYFEIENSTLFADSHVFSVLVGYGMINRMSPLTNVSIPKPNSIIYLGTLNTLYNLIIYDSVWSTNEVLGSYTVNILYSNGECEIYDVIYP
jgi:uncharacterized membrane protein